MFNINSSYYREQLCFADVYHILREHQEKFKYAILSDFEF